MKVSLDVKLNEFEGILLRGMKANASLINKETKFRFLTINLNNKKRKNDNAMVQIPVNLLQEKRRRTVENAREIILHHSTTLGIQENVQNKSQFIMELDIESTDELENFWIGKMLNRNGLWEIKSMSGKNVINSAKANVKNLKFEGNLSDDFGIEFESSFHQAKGRDIVINIKTGDIIGLNINVKNLEFLNELYLSSKKVYR
ncbi:hypothetical protein AADZ86_00875 [Colwelliaceae bacterium BS250]